LLLFLAVCFAFVALLLKYLRHGLTFRTKKQQKKRGEKIEKKATNDEEAARFHAFIFAIGCTSPAQCDIMNLKMPGLLSPA